MPAIPGAAQNGAAIRDIRILLGHTRADFADRLGIHHQSLTNIELEKRGCSVELLHRIARELGVSVAALIRTAIGEAAAHDGEDADAAEDAA